MNLILSGRASQSPRTGFIHQFLDRPGGDTIPLYENFCFALALISQKSVEGVGEGKDLLERLYAFQAPASFSLWEGNFPVYLHDFPRCWDSLLPLRIAPILQRILRDFSRVLERTFREKTKHVLDALLRFAERQRERKPYPPLWERRYLALIGISSPHTEAQSSEEWAVELITDNVLQLPSDAVSRLIHPTLGVYCGPCAQEQQMRFEPKPCLLEAWANFARTPLPLALAALPESRPTLLTPFLGELCGWQIRQTESYALSFIKEAVKESVLLRCIWPGSQLHSLCIVSFGGSARLEEMPGGVIVHFDLPQEFDVSRNDLIEVACLCDVSDETEIFIEKERASLFEVGDRIEIRTPKLTAKIRFELTEGEGDFCGHLTRSNRPHQMGCKEGDFYQAFDWKIALRTLRRAPKTRISLFVSMSE